MRKDPVSPELWQAVVIRDWTEAHRRGAVVTFNPCVAAFLDPTESLMCSGRSTLDHVKDQPMMGKRAPSDLQHLVTLCFHHHLDGWATSHRELLREYLRGLYGWPNIPNSDDLSV